MGANDAESMQVALQQQPERAFCTLNETPDLIRKSHPQTLPLDPYELKTIPDIVGDKSVARFAAMAALG